MLSGKQCAAQLGGDMAIEAKCVFKGHQIVVRIALDEPSAKLYIDGKVVDTSEARSGRGSLLRGAIEDSEKTHLVEVKRIAVFTTPKIFIDGNVQELVK
jgi:hypothetical protein